jgi:DNA-binding transcriptional regulator YiaG
MNGEQIKAFRGLLGLEPPEFAKLMSVDTRTVTRWESDAASPAGTAIAVIVGLAEAIRSVRDGIRLMGIVRECIPIGGVAYLLVRLAREREI